MPGRGHDGGVYRETPPPEQLAEVVSCLWCSDHNGPKRIVPDGCLDLIVGDGTVFVAGPDTRVWESDSSSTLHGIRFRPGRAPRVLGIASDELRDQRVELADLWGRQGVLTTERLLAEPQALAGFVGENLRETEDPEVTELVRRLETGAPRVSAVIGDLAVSERQLRRRFTQAVGYGPATFLRVARLQRAIARAGSAPLASLAADAGYADQAHLSRDCRELTGVTAGEFFTRSVAAQPQSA
jgi:AraC-like DNA-binding protein